MVEITDWELETGILRLKPGNLGLSLFTLFGQKITGPAPLEIWSKERGKKSTFSATYDYFDSTSGTTIFIKD